MISFKKPRSFFFALDKWAFTAEVSITRKADMWWRYPSHPKSAGYIKSSKYGARSWISENKMRYFLLVDNACPEQNLERHVQSEAEMTRPFTKDRNETLGEETASVLVKQTKKCNKTFK